MKLLYTYFWKMLPIGALIWLAPIWLAWVQIVQPTSNHPIKQSTCSLRFHLLPQPWVWAFCQHQKVQLCWFYWQFYPQHRNLLNWKMFSNFSVKNLALKKKAFQSPIYVRHFPVAFRATVALDGNRHTGTCIGACLGPAPKDSSLWFVVDLGHSYNISRVNITTTPGRSQLNPEIITAWRVLGVVIVMFVCVFVSIRSDKYWKPQ